MKFKLVLEIEYEPKPENYPAGLTPQQMAEFDQQSFAESFSHMHKFLASKIITQRVEVVE